MKDTLIDKLSTIEDFRNGNAIQHKLIDILTIAVLAVICSADHWTEMTAFGEAKKEWLKSFLEIPNGIPSADTCSRVFANINPEKFHQVFIDWTATLGEKLGCKVIAIDGKTIRRSKDKAKGKKAIHVVSAWACENNLVLGQLKVDVKSNEITAIPELLNVLDIKGSIITIDAMGTQKEIGKTIVENKGNYILSLKENHSVLYRDVKDYCESEVLTKSKQQLQKKGLYYIERDQDHGRYEKREYYVCNDIEWLWQKEEWCHMKGLGLCIRESEENGKKTIDHRYFIYSLDNYQAQAFWESSTKSLGNRKLTPLGVRYGF